MNDDGNGLKYLIVFVMKTEAETTTEVTAIKVIFLR